MAAKLPAKQSDAPNSYHTHRHSHADFTYSIQRHVISITDLNLGNRSVTNDIEYVLQQIEYYHHGSITSNRIMYRGIPMKVGTPSTGTLNRFHSFRCAKNTKEQLAKNF